MGAPWPAPAKLNRFLHILGRRADGYHRLQTAFQFLDYCDWIHVEATGDGVIRRRGGAPGIAAEQDLAVRAARLLQERSGVARGAVLTVDKRLPLGAGLGGGSSDAATVLVALNRIWGTGLGEDQLAALGLELGADVPVFVRGRAAWAEGVGEQLTPMEFDRPWFVVLRPDVTIPTAAVFSDPQLTRDSRPITISDFLAGRFQNDCEAVVTQRYPAVGEALAWLSRYGRAQLTGTGACVFLALDSEHEAQELLAAAGDRWSGFVAQGLNRSPLLDRLSREP